MADKRKKKEEEPAGAPGWMVTYGDMMSLLLCFFVLLLSFSTISEESYAAAMMSFRGALGILPQNQSMIQVLPTSPSKDVPRHIEQLARRIRERMQIMGKESDVRLQFDRGGLLIDLPSKVLFDTGSAELKAESHTVLQTLAEFLADVPGAFFEVRGHTDNIPLSGNSVYRDNYDLSYARARAVTEYLSAAGKIPLSAFEVVACGEHQPVAANETEEGRQANRRVELFVRGDLGEEAERSLRESIDALEGAQETVTPPQPTE